MTVDRKLSSRAAALLDAPVEERLIQIKRDKYLPYERSKDIIKEMESFISHPSSHRPPNILIAARSRNGKTEILKEFLARHPAKELRDGDAICAPVVMLQCPPGPDEETFFFNALSKLGMAPIRNEKSGATLQRLITVLRKIQTKVLLLDELNNLLAGTVGKTRFMMNMLKYISNETGISIVAAGTKDALHVLATDAQLESRFPTRVLPRWKENSEEFSQLLYDFEYVLPLKNASNLVSLPIRGMIFGLGDGLIGDIAATIKSAAEIAVENKEERITEKILQHMKEVEKKRKRDADEI